MVLQHYICITCGTQFYATKQEPENCPICQDERQYVGHGGQKWTTLEKLRQTHRNVFSEEEPGLHTIRPQPQIGIGQRAFLLQTENGNLLWDCVPLLDEQTVKWLEARGGLAAIAVSHPHFYATMVEWSHAFGGVPIYLHKADAKWVMRPDDSIQFWDGDTKPLFDGLTLVRTGGHFDGFQVLHSPDAAGGKGMLLSGDQPFVCADRRRLSFMYSYANLIPLDAAAIRKVADRLALLAFDRLYGAFPGQVVSTGARTAVEQSVERYLQAIGEC